MRNWSDDPPETWPENWPPAWIPIEMEIYKIPLVPSGEFAFMEFTRSQIERNHVVVFANKDSFIAKWGNPPTPGGLDAWKQDFKILRGDADDGFRKAHGCYNPVPLAEVGSILNGKLRLDTGHTRTIWLLLHGAEIFPLSCPAGYAITLAELVGI